MSAVRSLEVVASRGLDFQSGPEALSSLGSVSASRSVRFRRFYCIHQFVSSLVGLEAENHHWRAFSVQQGRKDAGAIQTKLLPLVYTCI